MTHILLPDLGLRVPQPPTISRVLGGGGGMLRVLGGGGGKLVVLDTFDSLDPAWTWLLGTGTVNAGALRAATLTADGHELITNGDFSAWTADNPNGWTVQGESGSDPVITEVSGQARIYSSGVAIFAYQNILTPGLTYLFACTVITVISGGVGFYIRPAGTVIIGNYSTIGNKAATFTANDVGFSFRRQVIGSANDVTIDNVSCQITSALAYHTGFARADGTFTAGIPFPASGTTPRSLAFRITDALNYWEVRILPNTAGTDTLIVEHVAGVQTTRASADVDWTAGATDEIQVVLSGDDIVVSHKKSGAGSWTAACSYLTMATGLTATKHGVLLYATAADQYTYWQASS